MINKHNFSKFLIFIIFFPFFSGYLFSENLKDNGASVFMYHRVGENSYPSTNVSIDLLKSHLQHVIKNKYNIISLKEVIKVMDEDGEFKEKTISFSIDDAYESFYLNGWPHFKKNQIPVTLFISTDQIDNQISGYMTWDQVRDFMNEGGTVGQHSASHMHMPLNNMDKVKNDILKSNKSFMKELGFVPNLFAYPYGETSKDIFNVLKEFGISNVFGQHSGVLSKYSNRYYLPRFSLNEQFGDLDRFIFAADSLPLIVQDFIPSEMFLEDNLKPNIEFTILNDIESSMVTCFSNAGGSWEQQRITNITKNRIQIILNDNFQSGRGRINCTAQKNGKWHWFGYQFLIK
jgi:peptidoglycan/xylan/chitin deacetylase (PgdA/CDA1 family)